MSSLPYQLERVNDEIKRRMVKIKELRSRQRELKQRLYDYMTKHKLDEFHGVTLKSVTPSNVKRKPKAEKRADAMKLFRQVGITDPEMFMAEYERTQKYQE